jgi:hypothetical protein
MLATLVDHLKVLHEAFGLTKSDFSRLNVALVAQNFLEKVLFLLGCKQIELPGLSLVFSGTLFVYPHEEQGLIAVKVSLGYEHIP